MPPVDGFEFLILSWIEAGIAHQTGMGVVPLTWTDLQAYCFFIGERLDFEEAQLILGMSESYVSGYYYGKDINAPTPWTPDDYLERQRERNAEILQRRKNQAGANK